MNVYYVFERDICDSSLDENMSWHERLFYTCDSSLEASYKICVRRLYKTVSTNMLQFLILERLVQQINSTKRYHKINA